MAFRLFWLALVILFASAIFLASDDRPHAGQTRTPSALALFDLNRQTVDPFQMSANAKAIVFVFMGVGCLIEGLP